MKKFIVNLIALLCISSLYARDIEDFFPGYTGADGFCLYPITSPEMLVSTNLPNSVTEIYEVDENGEQILVRTERKVYKDYTALAKVGDQWYAKVAHNAYKPVSREEILKWVEYVGLTNLDLCLNWEQYAAAKKAEQEAQIE